MVGFVRRGRVFEVVEHPHIHVDLARYPDV